MRKPIQLITSPSIDDKYATKIIALCDDGTIWQYNPSTPQLCWILLPSIPQQTNNTKTN